MIKELIEELERLKEAEGLLKNIYYTLGPYTSVLDDELRTKLRDFFDFDDSE